MYEFNLNYTDFFDYQKATKETQYVTKTDFISNFYKCIEAYYQINKNTTIAIARSVFERMSDASLHYHTPVHVLSMFQWWEENKKDQELTSNQQMAIWFHDAIYIPGAGPLLNEYDSATFMSAMLNQLIPYDAMTKIGLIIRLTGRHESLDSFTPAYNLVCDLDLCSLSWEKSQEVITQCIFEEYNYSWEDYIKGRSIFLKRLASKGFIFRTGFMKDLLESKVKKMIADLP
jgi:predicted metal-dependent HD superfamily phosphohydrolase